MTRAPMESHDSELDRRALKVLSAEKVNGLWHFMSLTDSEVSAMCGSKRRVCEHIIDIQTWLTTRAVAMAVDRRRARLPYLVLSSRFGTRTLRVLRQLRVKDIYDLTAVCFVDLLHVKEPSLRSWHEISSARSEAVECLDGIALAGRERAITDPVTLLLEAPSKDTLYATPLFSGLEDEFFCNPHFHPTWCADWSISELNLPHPARWFCRNAGVQTLEKLLLSRPDQMLMTLGFGSSALEQVHGIVRYLLLGGLEGSQNLIDYRNFEGMLETWIRVVSPLLGYTGMRAEVARLRLTADDGRLLSFRQIASMLRVSRACAGQHWRAARSRLSSRLFLAIVDRFWWAVDRKLREESPCPLDRLSQSLGKVFRWSESPQPVVLEELMSLNPRIEVDRTSHVVREIEKS